MKSRRATTFPKAASSHGRLWISAILLCGLIAPAAQAQRARERVPALPENALKNGSVTRRAFAPLADEAKNSVVRILVDGQAAALGTVIDAGGLAITKASELGTGELTARLSDGRTASCRVLAVDSVNDVALLEIKVRGLKAVRWDDRQTNVGQWVVTQGLGDTPDAVGIVSTTERKILPPRAIIGVTLMNTTIGEVAPGLGAARAGLQQGDVVLAVDDKPTATINELQNELLQYRDGTTVTLHIRRGEEEFDADVQMTAQSIAESEGLIPSQGGTSRFANRADRMNRMGSGVSERSQDFEMVIQHDTVLEPWECGGPLLDLDGRAVGINIARAGRVASYALPATLVRRIISDLKTLAASGQGIEQTSVVILPSLEG